MPNIKSAKKRVKVIATKTMQNRMLKGNLKAALKAVNTAIETDAADKAAVAQHYHHAKHDRQYSPSSFTFHGFLLPLRPKRFLLV